MSDLAALWCRVLDMQPCMACRSGFLRAVLSGDLVVVTCSLCDHPSSHICGAPISSGRRRTRRALSIFREHGCLCFFCGVVIIGDDWNFHSVVSGSSRREHLRPSHISCMRILSHATSL